MEMKTSEHIFQRFSKKFAVSEALWRFIELNKFSRVLSEIKPPILDLGCGNGEMGGALFEKVEVGVDMNSNAIKAAQNTGSYDDLLIADARDLPFQNNTFNTVFSNCTLEHIPNVQKCIKEVNRVLRDNSKFIITVPSEYFNNLLLLSSKYYAKSRKKHLSHVNLFSLKNWKSLLNECGFGVVRSEVYLSPSSVKLWDLLDIGYHLRIFGVSPIGFLWSKALKTHFIFSRLLKVLQKEIAIINQIKIGGGRLIIARKRQSK